MSKTALDAIRATATDDSDATGTIGLSVESDGNTNDTPIRGSEFVDPASFDGSGPGERKPRRRGRPPKSDERKSTAAAEPATEKKALHLKQLNKVLFSIHGLLARVTSNPELALEQPECDFLGDALSEVLAQYKIVTDPKTEAWVNLFMVGSALYGPRMFAIGDRKKKERAARMHNSTQHDNATSTQQPPNLQAA